MRKQFWILVLALLPLGMFAQEQESAETEAPRKEKKSNAGKVFTGISGGMMLHAGYLFADDPTKVFSNTGLGSYDYVKGLPKSGFAHAVARAECPDVPFYTNYEQLLDTLHPEIAVIATPPAIHYAIALACVERGVHPFVEKPLATTYEEVQRFFDAPLRGHYTPMYHTIYGEELIWLESHCPLGRIDKVRMELSDPYADVSGRIDAAYIGLGGCWLDSAPNALAPLLRLLPEYSLTEIAVSHWRDPQSGQPYASLLSGRAGKTEVEIEVRWDKGMNRKVTFLEADGHHYVFDHSGQAVWRDGEELFAYKDENRLTRQYSNLYRLYPERVPTEAMEKQMNEIIYKYI